MQRLLSLAAVAGAVMGMLWAAASASAATPGPSISWGPCSDPNLQAFNAQCGYLSVPLDYSKPNGQKIQLAVSRIEHTSSNYQGVVLTNPGGPGGSGLGLNPFLIAQFQADGYGDTAGDYDWIGFDPRGVGSSIPSISCDPNYEGADRPNYIPFTSQLLNTWLSRSKGYAQDCASQSSTQTALLHNMTTVDSAKDMDSIRQALGQQQITYYGYSYGTYLGQVYGTLFPSRVRRMILDSNVDPRGVWYQDNLDQDIAFNRNVNTGLVGWRSTTASTTWEPPRRPWRGRSTAPKLSSRSIRRAGWSVPTSGLTRSCCRRTTSSSTCPGLRCSPTGSTTTMQPRPTN